MSSILSLLTRQEASDTVGNDFARTLKAQRRAKALSIAALAQKTHTSHEHYCRWEDGTGFPKANARRSLAKHLWGNDYHKVKKLHKHGLRQRHSELTAKVLRKNKITLSDLLRFRRNAKTQLSYIKDALAKNTHNLTPAATKLLRRQLINKNKDNCLDPVALPSIAAVLQLNLDHLYKIIKIETLLSVYQDKKQKRGDFLLNNNMRRALNAAVLVLNKKDKRSCKALLARVPKRPEAPALTFAARLRHAAVSLAQAKAKQTVDSLSLELYYYGLSVPNTNAGVIKKVCRTFRLNCGQEMQVALRVEERTRRHLQKKMFHDKIWREDSLPRLMLNAVSERIMADYSQLSRRLFIRRVALQLSMAHAAQLLQLDDDDYLELEWCMRPQQSVVLQEPRLRQRLAQFLDISLENLKTLTSAATARREEQARQARNSHPAREAQLAAEAEVEQEGRVSDETPKLAAQRIVALLAEQRVNAATLKEFDKTFVTVIKETGICTSAAAERGKIEAAKIRFYLHGRGFPDAKMLQKICTGFAIKDSAGMSRIIAIERVVMEYQLAASRLGTLPLPDDIRQAMEQAAAVKMRDYSAFSRALFARRAELQLSPLEAARHLACNGSEYRKLERTLTPLLSRVLKRAEVFSATAEFLQLSSDALRELLNRADEQLLSRTREDTPATAAWNIECRMREYDISDADFESFDMTFAAHLRASGVSVAAASARCELDSTRMRQYVDGRGFPIDEESFAKVCEAFALDVAQMQRLVDVEKTIRRYLTDTSRVGVLSLPPATSAALEKAAEVVVAEHSELAVRLYRRRCELQITQREAAERIGIGASSNYRKLEQSIAPTIDRGLRKNPQVLTNLAEFLQITLEELQDLFVPVPSRQTQNSIYALKVASQRVLDNLQQCGAGVAELREFKQSFAGRLRNSGVSLDEACRRSVFPRNKIKPCYEGQHLPTGRHELYQFCRDFSLGDYDQVRRQLNIERTIRDYVVKTTRYGQLELPEDMQEALQHGVAVVMSDYCELSQLLAKRRIELRLSMEAAAQVLGLKTHEYYRKLERSIDTLPEGVLRTSSETVPRLAEFLQISTAQVKELIAAATAAEDDAQTEVVDQTTLALRQATAEIVKQLQEKNITPACLRGLACTFAAHLRATSIDPARAAVRVDMETEQIEPYLRGERLPSDEHEFDKICTAFAISDRAALSKTIAIEEIVNLYMQKISELGALPFPEEIKDALNHATQVIKSTYSELGKLLFRKRFDLKMPLEETAQELGIEPTQSYHELERSSMPAQAAVLRTNPAIVEHLAEFLELPLERVRGLVAASMQ